MCTRLIYMYIRFFNLSQYARSQKRNGNTNAYTRCRQFNQRYRATSRQRPLDNESGELRRLDNLKTLHRIPKQMQERHRGESWDRKLSRNQLSLAGQNRNVEIETGDSEFERERGAMSGSSISLFFLSVYPFRSSPLFHRNEIPADAQLPRRDATERGRTGEGEKNVITAGNDNEVYILITRRVARWPRMQY